MRNVLTNFIHEMRRPVICSSSKGLRVDCASATEELQIAISGYFAFFWKGKQNPEREKVRENERD